VLRLLRPHGDLSFTGKNIALVAVAAITVPLGSLAAVPGPILLLPMAVMAATTVLVRWRTGPDESVVALNN
jgi:uncharacterized membrane protein AbrB (regulator of aidB expression)